MVVLVTGFGWLGSACQPSSAYGSSDASLSVTFSSASNCLRARRYGFGSSNARSTVIVPADQRQRSGGPGRPLAHDLRDARRLDRRLAGVGAARVPEVAERLVALVAAVGLVVADVLVVGAQRGAVVRHRQRHAAGEDDLGQDVLLEPALRFLGLVAGPRRRHGGQQGDDETGSRWLHGTTIEPVESRRHRNGGTPAYSLGCRHAEARQLLPAGPHLPGPDRLHAVGGGERLPGDRQMDRPAHRLPDLRPRLRGDVGGRHGVRVSRLELPHPAAAAVLRAAARSPAVAQAPAHFDQGSDERLRRAKSAGSTSRSWSTSAATDASRRSASSRAIRWTASAVRTTWRSTFRSPTTSPDRW